jgi:hypothetical protein
LLRAPQAWQYQKNRQASVGMVSALAYPQAGQVRVLSRIGPLMVFLRLQETLLS